MAPLEAIAKERLADWGARFGARGLGLNVVALTGEGATDLKLLEKVGGWAGEWVGGGCWMLRV